jgi:hypothetical protein
MKPNPHLQHARTSFTDRARRYVQQSPQTKGLPDSAKRRLIKGIAGLMSKAYKKGFENGFNNGKQSK